MRKKGLLCIIVAAVMLLSIALPACATDPSDTSDKYTVSFDVGSNAAEAGVSTPASQEVEKGGKVVQPTIDAWEGHTLIGWYNGSAQWDFSENTVNSNMTLTANWSASIDSEVAKKYEQNLTWGEEGHLYVHYLRGAHSEAEQGTVNACSWT